MNLGEHYKYVNFVINRDQLGDPASPEIFNILIKKFSIEYYNKEYQSLVQGAIEKGVAVEEAFYESGSLKRFESTESFDYSGGAVPNYITAPDDFKRTLTLTAIGKGKTGTNPFKRPVSLVGPKLFEDMKTSVFRHRLSEKPIGREFPTKIQVIPMFEKFELVYIREVIDPYFDWCLSSGDEIIYMPVGSQIIDDGGVLKLISGGETLASSVTHPASPSLPYTSTSLELDWDAEWQKMIIEDVITAASRKSREGEMIQVSEQEKTK